MINPIANNLNSGAKSARSDAIWGWNSRAPEYRLRSQSAWPFIQTVGNQTVCAVYFNFIVWSTLLILLLYICSCFCSFFSNLNLIPFISPLCPYVSECYFLSLLLSVSLLAINPSTRFPISFLELLHYNYWLLSR